MYIYIYVYITAFAILHRLTSLAHRVCLCLHLSVLHICVRSGVKNSLNVGNAFSICAYEMTRQWSLGPTTWHALSLVAHWQEGEVHSVFLSKRATNCRVRVCKRKALILTGKGNRCFDTFALTEKSVWLRLNRRPDGRLELSSIRSTVVRFDDSL